MNSIQNLQPKIQVRAYNGEHIEDLLGEIAVHDAFTIEGVTFSVSKPIYASFRNNNFFLVVVGTAFGPVLRTVFLSRSQGAWRILNRYKYVVEEDGSEYTTWNDKGYDEQSLFLPIAVQERLFSIEKEVEPITHTKDKLLFYGTACDINTNTWYHEHVQEKPVYIPFVQYATDEEKVSPDKVTTKDAPTDINVKSRWNTDNALYGPCTYFHVTTNTPFSILFARASDGRAWVAGVENDSGITPVGAREQWVDGGDLVTPPFEYYTDNTDQTGGYGNIGMREGNYVDMYENYISKIPFVQYLLEVTGKEQ